MLVISFDVQKN